MRVGGGGPPAPGGAATATPATAAAVAAATAAATGMLANAEPFKPALDRLASAPTPPPPLEPPPPPPPALVCGAAVPAAGENGPSSEEGRGVPCCEGGCEAKPGAAPAAEGSPTADIYMEEAPLRRKIGCFRVRKAQGEGVDT